MRIGIDARFYGTIGKGLGRYTEELIKHLEEISAQNKSAAGGSFSDQYFIFLNQENFAEYVPKSKNFQKVLADCPWYGFAEQFKMPFLLNKYKLDLVHFPHFNAPFLYRKKFVMTIHDLILLEFPTLRGTRLNYFFYKFKFWAYRFNIWSALRRAEKIITVSNFTKKEILKYYPKNLSEDKIIVTYEAGGNLKKTDGQGSEKNLKILKKYAIMKPYVLYVGNAYPHKNLEKLLIAFSKTNLSGAHLVLVGKIDYFYGRLVSLARERGIKNVIFAGHVEEEDLGAVYEEASLYAFPSLYEGFGIPPLEAMAKKVPVISSDHPCMREILGDSALFFDGKREESIGAALKKVFQDEFWRNNLVARGEEQVKKYSWALMAQKTQEIYVECMRKSH